METGGLLHDSVPQLKYFTNVYPDSFK